MRIGYARVSTTDQNLDLQREVAFESVMERIDTASPAGRLMFHVLGALAEFERNLIRERILAGLAAAKARGISHANWTARDPGRDKSPDHPLLRADRIAGRTKLAGLRRLERTLGGSLPSCDGRRVADCQILKELGSSGFSAATRARRP